MVIEPYPSLALSFMSRSCPPDVSPIVVTEKQCDIIGHIESCIIVTLYLCKDSPKLRYCICTAIDVTDYLSLVFYHLLEGFHIVSVVAFPHGNIAIATHTDRYQVLIVLVPYHSLTEEFVKPFLVDRVVPGTNFVPARCVLFMSAHHGLMVRRSHHDAVFISQQGVQRVVFIKFGVPHGWP